MTATLTESPATHDHPRRLRWSCEDYEQLASHPFFFDRRTELIDGEIYLMPAMKDPHAVAVSLAYQAISAVFNDSRFLNRMQLPIRIGDYSEPEPDISVVEGPPRRYLGKGHPTTAYLLIEISETTVLYDLGLKARLYASATIRDYWVIDLPNRRVLVHRSPVADSASSMGFRYADIRPYAAGEFIEPLAAPGAKVAVVDLLP